MLNSELDSLEEVVAILKNYNNYTTYIEVSPEFEYRITRKENGYE